MPVGFAQNPHYFGKEDTLQDIDEAVNLYSKAFKLGSAPACVKLGDIYSNEDSFIDKKKAIEFYKEGINRGEFVCYSDLAKIFAESGNIDNSIKCWDKYFNSNPEIGETHKAWVLVNYVELVRSGTIPFLHKEPLEKMSDFFFRQHLDSLKAADNSGKPVGGLLAIIDYAHYLVYGNFVDIRLLGKIDSFYEKHNGGCIKSDKAYRITYMSTDIVHTDKLPIGCRVEFTPYCYDNMYSAYNIMPV